jgi:hypothetical protein
MEPKAAIAARLSALRLKLDQLEEALKKEGLPQTLMDSFAATMKAQRREIAEQERLLSDGPVSAGEWYGVLASEKASTPLLREALACLRALQARQRPVFGQVLAMAHKLLQELDDVTGVGWSQLTIPDDEDSFSNFVQVIRLRFPLDGIWDLPVLAHEFGHYAAYRLQVTRDGIAGRPAPQGPIDAELVRFDAAWKKNIDAAKDLEAIKQLKDQAQRERERLYRHLNEVLADVFATYVLGPAYGYTTLLLRFDPLCAHDDTSTHPSATKRALAITKTLQRMSADLEEKQRFGKALANLNEAWRAILLSAGQSAELDAAEQDWVTDVSKQFYDAFREARPGAIYRGWDEAVTLQLQLGEQSPAAATGSAQMRDVLNAAWLARRKKGSESENINVSLIKAFAEAEA